MPSALLILAAETAEKSETPFFIAGIAFGVWAIIIGVLGSRSASFADSRSAGSAIIGGSVALAAACMALSVYVST